jgi:hypothetical protein
LAEQKAVTNAPPHSALRRRTAERKRYLRLDLARIDLGYANLFAAEIIDRELHHAGNSGNTLLRALSVALVVTYWRPFSDNKGGEVALPQLPKKLLGSCYRGDDWATHTAVGNLRNRFFAHSDARFLEPSIQGASAPVAASDSEPFVLIYPNGWRPLEYDTVAQLRDMSFRLLTAILEEQRKLGPLVTPDTGR